MPNPLKKKNLSLSSFFCWEIEDSAKISIRTGYKTSKSQIRLVWHHCLLVTRLTILTVQLYSHTKQFVTIVITIRITVQDKILMFPSFSWKNHSQWHFQSFNNWYITFSKDLTVFILCYSLSELGVQRINLSNKAVFVFRISIRRYLTPKISRPKYL